MKLRTVALVGVVTVVLFTLTGCFSIGKSDPISGRMVFALPREAVISLGLTEEEFVEQMTDDAEDNLSFHAPVSLHPEKGTVVRKPYRDGRFLGVVLRFYGVPVGEFNQSHEGVTFSLKHKGDAFVLKIVSEAGGVGMLSGVDAQTLSSTQVRYKFMFPGDVTESNGEIDGRSVIWRPHLSEQVEMTATARDHGRTGYTRWIIWGIGIGIALAIAANLAFRARRSRAGLSNVEPVSESSGSDSRTEDERTEDPGTEDSASDRK